MQTLPPVADRYGREQRREISAAVAASRRLWRQMGVDFDPSWSAVAPQLLEVLHVAQERVASGALAYIPAVLADTGQRVRDLDYEIEPARLVGTDGAGFEVDTLAYGAVTHAKEAVAQGLTPPAALNKASSWLTTAVGTLLSDTARTAEKMAGHSRHVGWYVRMLEPPSCARCVVLAGKRTGAQQAFQRHPRCDCRNIPASESVAGDMTVDPRSYADSLTDEQLSDFFGSEADARAYRDGADIFQLVNSRRSGVRSAQVYGHTVTYTTEGVTRRGYAYRQMRNARYVAAQADVRTKGARYAQLRAPRLMPESIYQVAESRDDAIRLLRLYGWI